VAWKVAKAFFAWCEAREDEFASPARSIRKPAKEKSRDRVLDNTELKLTWEAADREGGPAGALVKLLILTGARRNEITELSRDRSRQEQSSYRANALRMARLIPSRSPQ
jgi:integrase